MKKILMILLLACTAANAHDIHTVPSGYMVIKDNSNHSTQLHSVSPHAEPAPASENFYREKILPRLTVITFWLFFMSAVVTIIALTYTKDGWRAPPPMFTLRWFCAISNLSFLALLWILVIVQGLWNFNEYVRETFVLLDHR